MDGGEPVCGNSVVELGEACDPPQDNAGQYSMSGTCGPSCELSPRCGDGVIQSDFGEACDDGNRDHEFCDYEETSCTVCGEYCQSVPGRFRGCGDGIVDEGESCDDGNAMPWDTCDANCETTRCADGSIHPGECGEPPGRFLSAGAVHTCGVLASGIAICFGGENPGDDTSGGDSDDDSAATSSLASPDSGIEVGEDDPVTLYPIGNAIKVSAGYSGTCAILHDQSAFCSAGTELLSIPQPAPGKFYRDLGVGWGHMCGLASDGSIACWSSTPAGATVEDAVLVGPSGEYSQLSVGAYHNCVLAADGTLACWGRNNHGQADSPPGKYVLVSAGGVSTCALAPSGQAACWGMCAGEPAPLDERFIDLSVGGAHACGVTQDGRVVCWGAGTNPDVTDEECELTSDCGQAVAPAGSDFLSVAAGLRHTCALKRAGDVECWGWDKWLQSKAPSVSDLLRFGFTDCPSGWTWVAGEGAGDWTCDYLPEGSPIGMGEADSVLGENCGSLAGDGYCHYLLNLAICGFDGGDCCPSTCEPGTVHQCDSGREWCLDPGASDYIYGSFGG